MRKTMLNSTFSKYFKSILCTINYHNRYLEIKEIGDGSVLRRKSKGQVLILLSNSSFCRSFRSTRMSRGLAIPFLMNGNAIVLTPPHASDDIIFMYIDWSAIVLCTVFRNTGQRYTFIIILPNFPEEKNELTVEDLLAVAERFRLSWRGLLSCKSKVPVPPVFLTHSLRYSEFVELTLI